MTLNQFLTEVSCDFWGFIILLTESLRRKSKISTGKKQAEVSPNPKKRKKKTSNSKRRDSSSSTSNYELVEIYDMEESDNSKSPEGRQTRARTKNQPSSSSSIYSPKRPAKKKARKQTPPPMKKQSSKGNGKRSRQPSAPGKVDKKKESDAGNINLHCHSCGLSFVFNRRTEGKKFLNKHIEICENASPEWQQAFMNIILDLSNGCTEAISGKGFEMRAVVKKMKEILDKKMTRLAKLMKPTLRIMVAVLKNFERMANLRQSTLEVSRDNQEKPLRINDLLQSGSNGLISALEFAGMVITEAPDEDAISERSNEQAHSILDNTSGATKAIMQIKQIKDLADKEKTFLDRELERMLELVENLHEIIATDGYAQEEKILLKLKEFRGKKDGDKDDDPPAASSVPPNRQVNEVSG